MKTDIYGLLGMIKDGKAPKIILFRNRQWIYEEKEKDYVNTFNEWLFDSYVITDILNEEVEILETTIHTDELNKSKKIEKLEDSYDLFEPNSGIDTSWTINEQILKNKINEIIDVINEKCQK